MCTTPTVWLGLPGDLIAAKDHIDHSVTRIGGHPVFPGNSSPDSHLRCQVCGKPLSLVLQAYAPHSNVQDRVIMVFGCTRLGCGKAAGAWRALRCQLPSAQCTASDISCLPQQCLSSPEEVVTQVAAKPAAGSSEQHAAQLPATSPGAQTSQSSQDAWGLADLGDWGFDASVTPAACSTAACAGTVDSFDFSELTSSLEAAGRQQHQATTATATAVHGSKQRHPESIAPGSSDGSSLVAAIATSSPITSCKGSAGAELPEYYIFAEAEPDASAAKGIGAKELQHVRQLLEAYQAESATAQGSISSSGLIGGGGGSQSCLQQPGPAAAVTAAAAATLGNEDEPDGSWAGEAYEKDEVRGVEHSYLKFSKRLARQPQQCARYSFNGALLWPRAQLPEAPNCAACGGPRVFELQLMPPLIQLTIEAAQMMRDIGQQVNTAVVDAVANWEWVTMAVFTCSQSCSSSSSSSSLQTCATANNSSEQPSLKGDVFLEEVILVNEQDCHTVLPAPAPGLFPPAGAAAGAAADVGGITPSVNNSTPAAAVSTACAGDSIDEEDQPEESQNNAVDTTAYSHS